MRDYTSKELDEKIHNFLARKLQEHPELNTVKREPNKSKRFMQERHDVMHTFMPAKLNLQF